MKLSIIFVNWNSTKYLTAAIASVLEWTSVSPLEIIVVDNASPDGDADLLIQQFGCLKLLNSRENLGFAKANNYGFRHSSGELVLFLNPDTKLIGPAIDQLVEQLHSLPDAGIVGCKLLNEDLTVQTSCIQRFPTLVNQFLDAELLRKRWPRSFLWGTAPLTAGSVKPVAVEVVSGACMLAKRSALERVGVFSEDYFMYAEDLDLCYKMKRAGLHNYFVSQASLIHYGGRSSTPELATVRMWESILQYCVKHHGPCYALAFRFVMGAAALGRITLLNLMRLLEKSPGTKSGSYSAAKKWSLILRTLLAGPRPHRSR